MHIQTFFKNKKTVKASFISLAAIVLFLPVVANADSYTVKSGDTLSAIASQKNTTVEKLAELNHISNVDLIHTGQVLELENTNKSQSTSKTSSTSAKATSIPSVGLNTEESEAKEFIAQKESSGSYTAQNGQYYGRYQLTITYLNGDLSPENQEKVANAYVSNRYGSWVAAKSFWLANGWY